MLTDTKSSLSLKRRGKHKIFIGMAPGVGKTYKMLEEGKLFKQEGTGFSVCIYLP
ncbi:hypothetical protein VB713_17675 [Anabaena cylindrica UHCC 0172]|uniref:hypothetical protein n=1 Tax=Anabaena cylindrica TaxID=1165 RepID=UPI002B1F5E65|nr:hypothetical protein [Anabaena cylindrica]MEA5552775.1 hypothetical protein [Anabaena cylindrica UHCC 0172]